MNKLAFGDVVRVGFPFADSEGKKERPAVVVSSAAYHAARPDVLVMAISSRLEPLESIGEFLITDWQSAGLTKPSKIKAVVATVKSDRVLAKIGMLNSDDCKRLQVLLDTILGNRAEAGKQPPQGFSRENRF